MATAQQIRAIYGLGRALSIATGGRDDLLHQFVEARTGLESVKELTVAQAEDVICALKDQMRGCPPLPERADKMSSGQVKKVWQLMYRLRDLDETPSVVGVGTRLCGIIRRELGVSATPKDPFRWLDYQQGNRLIERIKFYIKSAEARKDRAI
jgi:hypothetical protein